MITVAIPGVGGKFGTIETTKHRLYTAKIVVESVKDLLMSDTFSGGYKMPISLRMGELLQVTRELILNNGNFANDEFYIARETVTECYPNNSQLVDDYMELITPYIGKKPRLIIEG